jgi:hypothetical protein
MFRFEVYKISLGKALRHWDSVTFYRGPAGKKRGKKKMREEREKEPRHTEVALYPNE